MNYYPYNNQMNFSRIDQQIADLNSLKQQMMAQPQAPIQNIINSSTQKVDLEARTLNGENVNDIIVQNRTLFIDEKNSKIYIKETNGEISKTYDILIPKDAKDVKISELEEKIKEMERRLSDEFSRPNRTNNENKQSNTGSDKHA